MSDPKPYFLRGERRWDSNVKIPGKRAEVGRHDRVSDTSQARGEGEQKEAKKTSDISSQVSHGLQVSSSAQCVLCSVYFSAQLNKLRPILKFKKYYPIEHIFVPACSSARKIHFFKF